MEKILIVDASPLIYATFNSVGQLATQGGIRLPDGSHTQPGIPTGLRYGFIRAINSYRKKTKADRIVLAFDAKGPIKKAEGITEYKANREWTEAKAIMYGQVPALKEMLGLTCWTQIEAPGYEADDVIGALARAKAKKGDEIIFVSSDNDLCQLVSKNIIKFSPGKAGKNGAKATKDRFLTGRDVKDELGVWPWHLLVYRSIVGDQSDNLKGVGLSETAKDDLIKVLDAVGAHYLTLDEFEADLLSKLPGELRDGIVSEFDLVQMNYRVMSLHTPTNEELHITKGTKDLEGLTALFMQLEFRSLMADLEVYVGAA